MKQTIYESKSNKKKPSQFMQEAKKPQLKKLITRISQCHEDHQSKLIQQIIQNRKKKIKQLRQMRANFIYQKPMIPASSSDRFSFQTPISSGQSYLHEKIRTNILAPDRMYTRQPNMRAGSLDQSKIICYESNNDPRVISKKFEEYVRLMQSQNGTIRRKRLTDLSNQNHSLPAIKSPYKITMKKTYFKKFPCDQYNFYKPAIKNISRSERICETTIRQSNSRSTQKLRDLSSLKSSSKEYIALQNSISRDSINKNVRANLKSLKSIETIKTLDIYKQF